MGSKFSWGGIHVAKTTEGLLGLIEVLGRFRKACRTCVGGPSSF